MGNGDVLSLNGDEIEIQEALEIYAKLPAEPKRNTHKACVTCKTSHVACDSGRPCARCVRLGKANGCRDADRKKRGRPLNSERSLAPLLPKKKKKTNRQIDGSHGSRPLLPSPDQKSTDEILNTILALLLPIDKDGSQDLSQLTMPLEKQTPEEREQTLKIHKHLKDALGDQTTDTEIHQQITRMLNMPSDTQQLDDPNNQNETDAMEIYRLQTQALLNIGGATSQEEIEENLKHLSAEQIIMLETFMNFGEGNGEFGDEAFVNGHDPNGEFPMVEGNDDEYHTYDGCGEQYENGDQ
jgi:hypothetical protein